MREQALFSAVLTAASFFRAQPLDGICTHLFRGAGSAFNRVPALCVLCTPARRTVFTELSMAASNSYVVESTRKPFIPHKSILHIYHPDRWCVRRFFVETKNVGAVALFTRMRTLALACTMRARVYVCGIYRLFDYIIFV